MVAVASWVYVRRRDGPQRRTSIKWVVTGAVFGAVLWFPPVAEQITGSQGGNLGEIVRNFKDPPEEPQGLSGGLEAVLANLNPWRLLTEPVIDGLTFLSGPTLPGKLLLAAWAVAVVVSWRLRHRTLLWLHLLLAVVLALAVASAGRIFGPPFFYLALWGWGICAMLVIAVGWSACALLVRVASDRTRPRLAGAGAVGATAILLVVTAQFTVDAAYVDLVSPELLAASSELVPRTIEELSEGSVPGTGRDGRYLVTWDERSYMGGAGLTMLNELDRAGFDVGAPRYLQGAVTRHRVLSPEEATAQVRVSVGSAIETWEDTPGFRQIASFDPAGIAGRAEYERLRDEVTKALEAEGRTELTKFVEGDPVAFRYFGGLSETLVRRVERMIELGLPSAVFVGPP